MKRMALTLALLSGLVLGAVAISTAVNAAPRSRDLRNADEVRGADGEILRDGKPMTPEEQKTLGMAEAPAVVTRAGATCTVVDAIATGGGKATIDGKPIDIKTYEVACSEGLGYLLEDRGTTAKAFDCIQVASNAATAAAAPAPAAAPARGAAAAPAAPAVATCTLPANANPTASFQPIVTGSGARCTVTNVAFMGYSPGSQLNRYEVACSEGLGYIIDRPVSGPAKSFDCLSADAGGLDCKLTPKAQRTAFIAAIAARSGRACTVADGRFMGASASGAQFYEVACGGTQGYVLETKGGAFVRALDCLEAAGIGEGCKLTNISAVQEQREGAYLQALRAKGVACAGTEFRLLGKDSRQRDVVEFKCSDRPAGLVAFVPQAGAASADITNFDCFEAEGRAIKCQLTTHAEMAARLNLAMAAKSCQVSNFAVRGVSDTDGLVVEVACGNDHTGYIIDLPENRGPFTTANSCSQAASRGSEPCRLPENK